MANESKTQLKSYFQLGDKPNQAQFENLIDSMVDANQAGYPIFSTSKSYVVDDVVVYNGKFYRFISYHAAGAWVGTDVTETSIKAETYVNFTRLEEKVDYKIIELVGIGYSAQDVGAQVGQYYFSTQFNQIRYCTNPENSIPVPFIKGALYICQGSVFRWDFTDEKFRPISNGLLNVNTLYTATYPSRYTLEEAINAIPRSNRRPLQLISYRTTNGYEYAQYLVSDTSDNYWLDLSYWKPVLKSNSIEDIAFSKNTYNSLNINSWKGTTEFYTLEEAIALVPYAYRRTGLRLTFRMNATRWETAIFVAGLVEDVYWNDLSYWHIDNNIPIINVNDITNSPTTYYTLEEAIALVPLEYRCGGCIVTFRTGAAERHTYQYLPGTPTVSAWNNLGSWLELYGETEASLRDFISGDDSTYFSQMGYQIDKNDGSVIQGAASYYACTPYMPVQLGLVLNVCEGGVASRCSFYDKDYQFISSIVIATTNGHNEKLTLTSDNVPTNAVYLRATGSWENPTSKPYIKGYTLQTINNVSAEVHEKVSRINTSKVQWMALGDSITKGYYSDDVDPYYHLDPSKSYCRYIADLNHWNLNNQAIGGTGYICKGPRGDSINGKELVDTLDFSNTDLVTISYGVNDWKYNMQLGSMDDDISTDAIIPAMRYVIEKIISSNPLTKIVVITPINCAVGGNESTNYGIGYPFSNNGTLEDIFNAFVEVCEYYGIEYIDMTHSSIFNRKNLLTLLMDKVHPTIPALKVMGRELAAKIPFK